MGRSTLTLPPKDNGRRVMTVFTGGECNCKNWIWPLKEGNLYQWLEELKVIDRFSVRNEVGLSMLQEDKKLKIL